MKSPTLGFICHVVLFISLGFQYSNGQSYGIQMYHKFSNEVKEWMTWRHGIDTDGWPVQGSNEYYKALYHHDSARHGRKLASYSSLTFLGGNGTFHLTLGYLFYTVVQVGTPNVSLLVALDTGSDVFWVPCDCEQCAPTTGSSYGLAANLQTYSPSASQTSKPVSCNNTLCSLSNGCSKSSDQCPYSVTYVSANTSTTGYLVEDMLYLTPGDGSQNGKVVKAPITFGCGMVQTGQLLQGVAPDGLLGLGIENISVPTILYNSGLVSNSFSMCFPTNSSVGRLTFGDTGSSDQKETPFIINETQPTYYVGVQEFYVGNSRVQTVFQAVFDSGTSFTLLADPVYKSLTSNYHLQTNDTRVAVNDSFEFCYESSNSQSINPGLEISFTFNGGNNFSVIQPTFPVQDSKGNVVGYCLAVLQGDNITTIIGQNFMAGYEVIFDREQSKLGWKEANCYDLNYGSIIGGAPSTSSKNSSTSSPPLSSISPDAKTGDGTHLSLSFFYIALLFSFSITMLHFSFI